MATGIVALVSAISADVVAGLATAGYPPLTDGGIVIGRLRQDENSAPPRVIFVPKGSRFEAPSRSSTANISGAPQADLMRQIAQRSLATEVVQFEVRCWGAATTPDPNGDFDATVTLYQQVIRSVRLLAPGIVNIMPGRWLDSSETATQIDLLGHVFVFGLEIPTPVTDALLAYVPQGTAMLPTTQLQPADPTIAPEIGCQG